MRFALCLALTSVCLPVHAQAGSACVAKAIVGSFVTSGGDGGPAIQAQLSSPSQLARDAAGNVYIADSGNNKIRKVDTSGLMTTVAGNGAASSGGDGGPAVFASLNYPTGVAVDSAGNIYVQTCLSWIRIPSSFARSVKMGHS